jgi:hypothetical protein
VNGARINANNYLVRREDILTISLNTPKLLKVINFLPKRGSAELAQTTYLLYKQDTKTLHQDQNNIDQTLRDQT